MERPQRGLAVPAASAGGDLQRAFGDGDFEAFVAPYVQRLYRFLVLRLGDERDARDALQETLLAAWQGLPRLRERDRPWSWLAGIAAHKAADSSRRRFRLPQPTRFEETYEEDDTEDVLAALQRLPTAAREVLLLRYLLRLSEVEVAETYEEDDTEDVLAALQRLPTAAREVLLLRYLLRLSEVEVAEVLGVRVGTVKSRAARARRLLLEELR